MVSLVDWKDDFVLGVAQIDEHHQKLVDIINRCYRALMLNNHSSELAAIVKELQEYTVYHFAIEEKLMREFGYEEASPHRAAHESFVASVADFQLRYDAGESFIAIDVLTYLKDWLVAHIQSTDRDFTRFLTSKGII